jgi:flagellar biosynthesis anti-sigma factor FlgM
MRITDPNGLGNTLPAQTPDTSAIHPALHPDEGDQGTITAGSDRAHLSGVAGRLSEILQQDPPARSEKVTRLKEAVASGTYHVDSAAVSRALVDEALTTASNKA